MQSVQLEPGLNEGLIQENLVSAENQVAYHKKCISWEADRELDSEKSKKFAWNIVKLLCALLCVCIISLATLAPLKRIIPYVFVVDKATGNIEFVTASDDRRFAQYQDLIDKSNAARYVQSYEAYNYRLLQKDYDTVLSWSSDTVGREYAHLYDVSNPKARDKVYGQDNEVKVTIISVTLSKDDVSTKAVVRFSKALRKVDAGEEDPNYFIATLTYEYAPSMTGQEKELLRNPTGYKVTSYRVDQEINPVK